MLSSNGVGRMIGTSGSDSFIFNRRNQFGKKKADVITQFKCGDGDKILFSSKALRGFDDFSKINLKVAKSKKSLRIASTKSYDFIYFQKKGQLYFDHNDEKRGFGKGGLIAHLIGKPDLDLSCIAELI